MENVSQIQSGNSDGISAGIKIILSFSVSCLFSYILIYVEKKIQNIGNLIYQINIVKIFSTYIHKSKPKFTRQTGGCQYVQKEIVIFFGLLWKHNGIKMRISKDEYKPQVFNWKIFSLFAGLCLVGVGFAITILFFLISGFSYGLLGGLIPFVLGIMFLIFYKIISNEK